MNGRRVLGVVLIGVGIVAVVVGIIYLTVDAKSLPSVLGQLHGFTGHRSKRGIAALIVGAALLVGGGVLMVYRPAQPD